jgi:GxxExxY protein
VEAAEKWGVKNERPRIGEIQPASHFLPSILLPTRLRKCVMPVTVHAEIRRLSQAEFGQIAFEVMRHVFAVHNELGRCFDEDVYQRVVAHRCGGRLEVPVDVAHGEFQKRYFLDLLVADGAPFEFKTVDVLTPAHRAQLLNYLLLTGLSHGKLVNLRTPNVQHEFVNTTLTAVERAAFTIDATAWDSGAPGAARLKAVTVDLLRDLGAGLALPLYQEALVCLMGGDAVVMREVAIMCDGRQIGSDSLPHTEEGAALRLSALDDGGMAAFGSHLQRYLMHTSLHVMHWINVNARSVTLVTLHRGESRLMQQMAEKGG